jgi:hypothetical protein
MDAAAARTELRPGEHKTYTYGTSSEIYRYIGVLAPNFSSCGRRAASVGHLYKRSTTHYLAGRTIGDKAMEDMMVQVIVNPSILSPVTCPSFLAYFVQ